MNIYSVIQKYADQGISANHYYDMTKYPDKNLPLSDVAKENLLNTWVINHTELPTELFDKKVEAVREGGFSKLRIETIS